MQDLRFDEFVNGTAGRERRVELNQGVRPQDTLLKAATNLSLDAFIPDADEALYIEAVVIEDLVSKPKYVLHARPSLEPAAVRMGRGLPRG